MQKITILADIKPGNVSMVTEVAIRKTTAATVLLPIILVLHVNRS